MYPNMDKTLDRVLCYSNFWSFMFDKNQRQINMAYQFDIKNVSTDIVRPVSRKDVRKTLLKEGKSTPPELELTNAEGRVRSHIQELLRQKYI